MKPSTFLLSIYFVFIAAQFLSFEPPRQLKVEPIAEWHMVEKPVGTFTITASSETAMEEALKELCQEDRRFVCLQPPVHGGLVLVVQRKVR